MNILSAASLAARFHAPDPGMAFHEGSKTMGLKQFLLTLAVGLSGESWGWEGVPSNTTRALHGMEHQGGLIVGAGGTILVDSAIPSGPPPHSPDYRLEASGTSRDLYAVDCINTCWIVGDSGTILHKENGTWRTRSSGTLNALRAVQFISDTAWGYAVGDSGTILRRNDAVWEKQTSGVSQDLKAVQFLNNYVSGSDPTRYDTGFVVGDGGTILKTLDRGATWTPLVSGVTQTLYALRFGDASRTGFAVGAGGTILKTTNQGLTWTSIPSGTTNALYSISFREPYASSQHGMIVGQGGTMLITSDGGNTWTSTQSGTVQNLYFGSWGLASSRIAVGAAGTIVASNSPVSISGQTARPATKAGVRLILSDREGIRIQDAQGRLYNLHGKRIPSP